jgi:hypothetical protein
MVHGLRESQIKVIEQKRQKKKIKKTQQGEKRGMNKQKYITNHWSKGAKNYGSENAEQR